jgi:hypothetical protein
MLELQERLALLVPIVTIETLTLAYPLMPPVSLHAEPMLQAACSMLAQLPSLVGYALL